MSSPYSIYKQSDVSKNWMDTLLESDRYKNVFRQGLKETEVKGTKLVKEETEKAQKELKEEAKSSFDPLGLALGFVNPFLAAGYSGTKAYSKSKKMSALSQRLKKNLKDKFGNAGWLTDLYEGTGMDKSLGEMKTSTLDDILSGGIAGGTSLVFSKMFGDLGDKLVKPGTEIASSTAGEVIAPKAVLDPSIGIKHTSAAQGLDLLPKSQGSFKTPISSKLPTDTVGFQMPKMDFKLGQSPTMQMKPGGLGVKASNLDMFDFTSPTAQLDVVPGYIQQLKEYYNPSEIAQRGKDIYGAFKDKGWAGDLLKLIEGYR